MSAAVESSLQVIFSEISMIWKSIGVTSGKAFCGDVGSSQRREYAMVGDIVVHKLNLFIPFFSFHCKESFSTSYGSCQDWNLM
jgi:hypothetical protein